MRRDKGWRGAVGRHTGSFELGRGLLPRPEARSRTTRHDCATTLPCIRAHAILSLRGTRFPAVATTLDGEGVTHLTDRPPCPNLPGQEKEVEKTKAKLDVGGLCRGSQPLPVLESVCMRHVCPAAPEGEHPNSLLDYDQLEHDLHAFGQPANDNHSLLLVAEMVSAGAEPGSRRLRPSPWQRGRGQEGEQREGLLRVNPVSKLATPLARACRGTGRLSCDCLTLAERQ